MNRFTVEEINLMCVFDTGDRKTLIAELRDCLPGVDEPEVADIVRTVIGKLENTTDEEYDEIGFFPATEYIEQED